MENWGRRVFLKYLLKYFNNFENLSLSELAEVTQEGFDWMGKLMHVSETHVRLIAVLLFPASLHIKNIQKSLQLQEV